ncbi:hypothetical protein IU414_24295 [Nocardia farcinica]|uniref:hypothetical protein n=1 Tax=Nocardia farcinica TaxID=37329 RepID=UPI000E035781|nr:hypothetical protein [Nocardia farcinica]MBA4857875.1 hypothetical protein [Nocardia farcinica]MBC9819073.1 hypothetical protein [Nocardia farcinica]MBF6068963.1 hypothetical protein [Nocardia farcinica]MBF6269052.1 hypothetical protein [Nocardia farcinica]MBF6291194.1 hypothetical protein [Nocardia farcinica]
MVRIGVSGHMNITEPTAVKVYDAVRALLAQHDPNEVVGVSCLARGADSVFARAVLDVGGRLEVVLPSRNYRAVKVKPDHAAEFDALVERAARVRVMDFDDAGRDAYEAANEAVLGSVDRLVAVWDGAAGQSGGTASVVESARARGLPVDVIWPAGAARAAGKKQ